ncbi:hypothetical protein SAMN04488007_1042 [Maribacter aquivivus]|uniref:Uncharacterized protein n=1 Tax=Maribacter aquivivus TaxID=228958 RepID=A0A1M6L663_9FLAO|nr:hypothetical protein SAMN04488007_1042 [Maribacter aquivivus]
MRSALIEKGEGKIGDNFTSFFSYLSDMSSFRIFILIIRFIYIIINSYNVIIVSLFIFTFIIFVNLK